FVLSKVTCELGGLIVGKDDQRYRPDLDFAGDINRHEIRLVSDISRSEPIFPPFARDVMSENHRTYVQEGAGARVEHVPVDIVGVYSSIGGKQGGVRTSYGSLGGNRGLFANSPRLPEVEENQPDAK